MYIQKKFYRMKKIHSLPKHRLFDIKENTCSFLFHPLERFKTFQNFLAYPSEDSLQLEAILYKSGEPLEIIFADEAVSIYVFIDMILAIN